MNKLFFVLLVVSSCCGAPNWQKRQKNPIGIVGFPFSKGQPKVGVEDGPVVIKSGGLKDKLIQLHHTVEDHGDLNLSNVSKNTATVSNMKNHWPVGDANKLLSGEVKRLLEKGQRVLVLGGDHSLGIGSVHGHCQVEPDLIVIWVDAHADINTPLTTLSGNMHGMSVSFLVKELQSYQPDAPSLAWCKPCISASSLVYIGLRDVDPGERKIIEELNIRAYSMHEVDRLGIKRVLEEALTSLDPRGERPIHLSFDVDSMDPTLTHCTGTPVPGGLTLREAFYIAEEIAKTKRLSVLDIVEFNPRLAYCQGEVNKTLDNTLDVITKFYGSRRQGNYPQGYRVPKPQQP